MAAGDHLNGQQFGAFNPDTADYSHSAHAYGHSVPGHDDGITYNDAQDASDSASRDYGSGPSNEDSANDTNASARVGSDGSRLTTFHPSRDAGGLYQAN
jgi:hypothetical protein